MMAVLQLEAGTDGPPAASPGRLDREGHYGLFARCRRHGDRGTKPARIDRSKAMGLKAFSSFLGSFEFGKIRCIQENPEDLRDYGVRLGTTSNRAVRFAPLRRFE